MSIIYPNGPEARFDVKYYAGKHRELLRNRLEAHGLVDIQVDDGMGSIEPETPAPFIAIGHLTFRTLENFQEGFAKYGSELMADVPNFTNLQPQVQVSRIVQ